MEFDLAYEEKHTKWTFIWKSTMNCRADNREAMRNFQVQHKLSTLEICFEEKHGKTTTFKDKFNISKY